MHTRFSAWLSVAQTCSRFHWRLQPCKPVAQVLADGRPRRPKANDPVPNYETVKNTNYKGYANVGFTNFLSSTNPNITFPNYVVLKPNITIIPLCQTETQLALTISLFLNYKPLNIGECTFLPLQFGVFRLQQTFSIDTCT